VRIVAGQSDKTKEGVLGVSEHASIVSSVCSCAGRFHMQQSQQHEQPLATSARYQPPSATADSTDSGHFSEQFESCMEMDASSHGAPGTPPSAKGASGHFHSASFPGTQPPRQPSPMREVRTSVSSTLCVSTRLTQEPLGGVESNHEGPGIVPLTPEATLLVEQFHSGTGMHEHKSTAASQFSPSKDGPPVPLQQVPVEALLHAPPSVGKTAVAGGETQHALLPQHAGSHHEGASSAADKEVSVLKQVTHSTWQSQEQAHAHLPSGVQSMRGLSLTGSHHGATVAAYPLPFAVSIPSDVLWQALDVLARPVGTLLMGMPGAGVPKVDPSGGPVQKAPTLLDQALHETAARAEPASRELASGHAHTHTLQAPPSRPAPESNRKEVKPVPVQAAVPPVTTTVDRDFHALFHARLDPEAATVEVTDSNGSSAKYRPQTPLSVEVDRSAAMAVANQLQQPLADSVTACRAHAAADANVPAVPENRRQRPQLPMHGFPPPAPHDGPLPVSPLTCADVASPLPRVPGDAALLMESETHPPPMNAQPSGVSARTTSGAPSSLAIPDSGQVTLNGDADALSASEQPTAADAPIQASGSHASEGRSDAARTRLGAAKASTAEVSTAEASTAEASTAARERHPSHRAEKTPKPPADCATPGLSDMASGSHMDSLSPRFPIVSTAARPLRAPERAFLPAAPPMSSTPLPQHPAAGTHCMHACLLSCSPWAPMSLASLSQHHRLSYTPRVQYTLLQSTRCISVQVHTIARTLACHQMHFSLSLHHCTHTCMPPDAFQFKSTPLHVHLHAGLLADAASSR
jgi:hypothetical protein